MAKVLGIYGSTRCQNKDMDIEEKTELREKDKKRKQKQRAHQTPEEKYEISLKNIDQKQNRRRIA